ncbi:MAG TPA: flagellar hook protein FlgE [Microbacteriaceae bacterium]|nr:flagellar hook protein FlgE [Microbacteriaceae bacterium]
MLRSLDSGVSGLQAQQTMLDVVANNIANVNTTGYKATSVEFEDTLSQVLHNASGPNANNGGTNPAQVGLGVEVAGIATDFTGGATQTTGQGTNMMINGNGFFIVNNGGQTAYTRAGAFTLDGAGDLVAPDGSLVQGWSANGTGQVQRGAAPGTLHIPLGSMVPATATTSITMSGNLPEDATTTPTPTTLTSQAQVYDSAGKPHSITLTYTFGGVDGSNNATWNVAATDETGASLGTGTVVFGSDGSLTSGGTMSLSDGITVDMSKLTGYAGTTSVNVADQNGNAAGTLQSFTIGTDGTIEGAFSNGAKQAIGQVAIATFSNPSGLEKLGDSLFSSTANSGLAQVGAPGSGGSGTISADAVEGSNVDLGREFTNLIVAQRAFQASARVITTSDDVLQELVNLKTN